MKKLEIVEELALYMHNKSINESEIIEKLKDIDDSEEVDRDGRTLLINACFYNRIEIVKFLVSQKANVNSKDKIGNTPLFWFLSFFCLGFSSAFEVSSTTPPTKRVGESSTK